ncbi:MAG: acyltransferase [Gemmatimonadota bacterium]
MTAPTVPGVHGIRAFAVLLLLTGHYARPYGGAAEDIVFLANYSMILFLVLTGFIVTVRMAQEFENTRDVDVEGWFKRKLIRTYPTLVGFVAFSTLFQIVVIGEPVPLGRFFGFLGPLGNYYYSLADNDPFRHPLGHLWAIYVGAQFLGIWMFVARGALARGRLGSTVLPLIGVIVVSGAIRSLAPVVPLLPDSYGYLATEARMGEVAAGVLAAVLMIDPEWRTRIGNVLCSPWVAGAATLALFAVTTRIDPVSTQVRGIATALILAYLVSLNGASIAKPLESRLLFGLSTISYSVVVWHLYGLQLDPLLASMPFVIRAPTVWAVKLAACTVAWFVFERSFRRLAGYGPSLEEPRPAV